MADSLPVRPHFEWYKKAAKKKLAVLRAAAPEAKLAESAVVTTPRAAGFMRVGGKLGGRD